ncbi:mechanosensitive ion channel family protein [Labrys monachus]|uniref:Small-conductance mechanosensitive channel n=1 Tax=Labrys monachus TaxID=217067 RepID=A0ABU0FPB5_9HYPH|nr:mechanosensitive ion channel family protein [Labrys monachus]MDQ0395913.1 small-conductance mechanosensitive channel [Labrys monachus]
MPLPPVSELILTTVLACLTAGNWRIAWRPAWLRMATGAFFFVLLTLLTVKTSGPPVAPVFDTASMAIGLWQQGLVAAWWILGGRLVVGLLRLPLFRERGTGEAKLGSDLVAGIVYIAAVLAVVNFVFDLPVRALLATSGVIAIVLALALQNTLADVFAGIAVGIEHPYSIGDRIWIDGAIEGVIVQVNWRSIRIRTDGNDIATVPNSLIAKARVINRSKPTTRRDDAVQVSCDASAKPDLVMDLLRQATMLCPKILADPAPSVLLSRIGLRSNSYDIAFSVAHTDHLGAMKSLLLKEVLRQFRYHNIRTSLPAGAAVDGLASPLVETLTPEQLLAEIPLFAALAAEKRDALARTMVRRMFEPTKTVLSQGEAGAGLFIVASGVVEGSRMMAGHSHVVGRFGPGDSFGEISLLTDGPNPGTLVAVTRCILFELRRNELQPLLAAEPRLAAALEASARRGQAFLARDAAKAASAPPGPPAQFLAQIRAFFKP